VIMGNARSLGGAAQEVQPLHPRIGTLPHPELEEWDIFLDFVGYATPDHASDWAL
jgi:hypothetical protein